MRTKQSDILAQVETASFDMSADAPSGSSPLLAACARERSRSRYACVHTEAMLAFLCYCMLLLRPCSGAPRSTLELVKTLPDAETSVVVTAAKTSSVACASIADLISDTPGAKAAWRKQARVAAVLGGAPKSLSGFKSGLKSWIQFAVQAYDNPEEAFPPTLEGVLAWSTTFRSLGTFMNYLGCLRKACHALNLEAPPYGHAAIKRAMTSIVKRQLTPDRPRLHLDRIDVRNMVLAVNSGMETLQFAMLWLVSYIFLLRLPSEVGLRVAIALFHSCCTFHLLCQALPMQRGYGRGSPAGAQSLLWHENNELCLELASRKNRQRGSGVIRRRCTCQGNMDICPIHVLWETFAARAAPGQRLWPGVTAGGARTRLRQLLSKLHVDNAMLHNTHDFRRGHARVVFVWPCVCSCAYFTYSFSGPLAIRCNTSRNIAGWSVEERSLLALPRRGRIREGTQSVSMCCHGCHALHCRKLLTRLPLSQTQTT